ncbi:ADP-ribosylation factor-like protein 2-binding protein [Microtus ochrogaster]|uniref:ADP-ribosylation factor-like protein 2-binding protein n=1 Tax=Microtus ochrogaster TaxID=79684 RepID=A0A8J6FYI2_MICOH|nr:ADP-ribosylation factor-like protein 2-binding protein [Microtus ochrogaster]KAH0519926.1 ADP-ribosylation factor-like protein 2-binding protein [Microtus ochrogaster]
MRLRQRGPEQSQAQRRARLEAAAGPQARAGDGGAPTMDAIEEESFALSFSSASDAEFDAVVGCFEDIIMEDEFQLLQRNFMDKYCQEFEDTEENKLTYTPIFNEYISLVEKYIEEQLLERISGFNMAAFTTTLQNHKDEVAGDIFDMLLTFTAFLAFKMFLYYRAEKEGRGLDLSSGLVVTSLCKSSSTAASQNNLRH